MNKKTIYLSAALIFLSCNAFAQGTDSNYSRNGIYFGAGGSYILEDFDLSEAENYSGFNINIDASDGYGYSGLLGYRFHPNFAGELSFNYYTGFDLKAIGIDLAEADAYSLLAKLKCYPLTGRIQPYGMVGVGLVRGELEDKLGFGYSEKETGPVIDLGLGIDAYITSNFILNFEASYLLAAGNVDDFNLIPLLVSVQYRF